MDRDGGNQPEMDNYILTYYQQIKEGSVVVGKWVSLVYDYLIKALNRANSASIRRKQTAQSALSKNIATIPRKACAGSV